MHQNGRQQNYVWSVDCVIVSFSHDLRWQFDLNPSQIFAEQLRFTSYLLPSTPTGLFSDSFRMEISYLMNFNVLQKLQRILLQITPCPFIVREKPTPSNLHIYQMTVEFCLTRICTLKTSIPTYVPHSYPCFQSSHLTRLLIASQFSNRKISFYTPI